MSWSQRMLAYIAAGVLALAVMSAGGAFLFVYSGAYNIAASEPHWKFVRYALTMLQQRSVRVRARALEARRLDDPALVQRGLVIYREQCLICHGAPGQARGRPGVGLNPNPPSLMQAAGEWSDRELYWIIANGLKMAGMPAFELGASSEYLWAVTAFVRRLETLAPDEYRQMVAVAEGRAEPGEVEWVVGERGWRRMAEQADFRRGKTLIQRWACTSCHVVPGIRAAGGGVGPPLNNFGRRRYIAGLLSNNPDNLVRWIMNPERVHAHTAMPTLGVPESEALDMAAYLLSLR